MAWWINTALLIWVLVNQYKIKKQIKGENGN